MEILVAPLKVESDIKDFVKKGWSGFCSVATSLSTDFNLTSVARNFQSIW